MSIHLRTHAKSKSVLISGISAIIGAAYRYLDLWGNLSFLVERLQDGTAKSVLGFFVTERGANVLFFAVIACFVLALLFEVRRTKQDEGKEEQWHETAAYDLTTSENKQTARAPDKQEAKPEPNLICTSTAPRPAYVRNEILVEGILDGSTSQTNVLASVAEFSNEFNPSREVADVEGISAEIFYQSSSGRQIKVKRGSWLRHSAYKLDFSVNDAHRLIIAFGSERSNDYLFMLTREITDYHDSFENRIGLLDEDLYQIKVRLISEAERKLYKEFDFVFTITRKPELAFELVEARAPTPKEIRQQLESFLREGGDLLRDFPREKQATHADIAKVDEWEKKVVSFLGRCPDHFSTTLFLADFPEVPVAGGAQGGNWPSLKKLARRLATLRGFIDELRRG